MTHSLSTKGGGIYFVFPIIVIVIITVIVLLQCLSCSFGVWTELEGTLLICIMAMTKTMTKKQDTKSVLYTRRNKKKFSMS